MACGLNLELGWDGIGRVVRSKDATDTVHVEDAIRLDVRLLPVMPEDAMKALLREQLREQGWVDQPDGTMVRVLEDGAEATLEADARAVTLRVKSTRTVQATVSVTVTNKDKSEGQVEREAAAALDVAAADRLKALATERREALEREHVKALTAREPEVRAALQEPLNRTYRKALEQRAREIGELESLKESGDARGSYEVTIVVRA